MIARLPIEVCPKCQRKRVAAPGTPHSPHFNSQNLLVDCVGDQIDTAVGCGAAANPPTAGASTAHESPAAVSSSGAGPGRGVTGSPSPGSLPAILPMPCESPGPAPILPAGRDAVWPGSFERPVRSMSAPAAKDSQAAELERVTSAIGRAIIDFCTPGRTFHADELRAFVTKRCGGVAPASADRVLRELRANGSVPYVCINRSKSLYQVRGQ